MRKIKVIEKFPGEPVGHYKTIPNTLRALQNCVGGFIETVTLGKYVTVVCDEDGRLAKKPFNCEICGIDFVGTILIVGVDGDDFDDCPITLDDFRELCLAVPAGAK